MLLPLIIDKQERSLPLLKSQPSTIMRFEYFALLASLAAVAQAGPKARLLSPGACTITGETKFSYERDMDSQFCFDSAGRTQIRLPKKGDDDQQEYCLLMSPERCDGPSNCWTWSKNLFMDST